MVDSLLGASSGRFSQLSLGQGGEAAKGLGLSNQALSSFGLNIFKINQAVGAENSRK